MLGLLLLVAIFAPLITPYDPINWTDPDNHVRTPPCIHLLGCAADQPEHIFGLDSNGRDLFSRIVYASRVSICSSAWRPSRFGHRRRHAARRAGRLRWRLVG